MFRLGVLFFLAGIIVAITINSLSYIWYLIPTVAVVTAICTKNKLLLFWSFSFTAGFIWLFYNIIHYGNLQLPKNFEKKTFVINAIVISIPQYQDHLLSFIVNTSQLPTQDNLSRNLKLDWYIHQHTLPNIKPGDKWQFTIKLKRPHSLMNPGGFDYLAWMMQEHITADGYIISAQKLIDHSPGELINQIRNHIKIKLNEILGQRDLANFISALTIGVRENISVEQWQILQNTGTNHLIAIAGLHIGFVTGLLFFVTSFIWKRIPKAPLWLATPRAAAVAALLSAWGYAALAGFSLPTQRAIVMITIFMGCVIWRKILLPWTAWCLALFIVLWLNPFSVLSAAFWLSFSAVALIIFVVSGRVGASNYWWRLAKIQFALALGLLPITLLFFHNGSLIAPLANILVIPIVGFFTVPLSLLGVIVSLFSVSLAKPILLAALATMHLAWEILHYLADMPYAHYPISLEMWPTISISIGVILLLLPRGMPGKLLSLIFFLPLFLLKSPSLNYGEIKLTVLDVGQGLSVVIRTQHHLLIYDTGASYGENYDMGKAVVIPYLQYYHIAKVDKVIISHGDNDHIGGLKSILQMYSVKDILTSVPNKIKDSTQCLAGQQWQWDGVNFAIIYPDTNHLGLDNNSSCVLKISSGSHNILLTGDIEKIAEKYLVAHTKKQLSADILVPPHHGSKTSSTSNFIKCIQPKFVIFPTGYLNRFHFPNPATIIHYNQIGALMYNTATAGAVKFTVKPGKTIAAPSLYCYTMQLQYFRYCAAM